MPLASMTRKEHGPFSEDCRRCPRLTDYLSKARQRFPAYHGRPVSPFGDERPRLLIVGLAPGLHGANRTGRPFTGDHAGLILYRTLHRFGLASAPESVARDDGLELLGCRITNAVKCAPPENKPDMEEIKLCNKYLSNELHAMDENSWILALGGIAHGAVLRAMGLKLVSHPFAHGAMHSLPDGRWLMDSYHCSRYNTQTGRLTEPMFEAVFSEIVRRLGHEPIL